MRASSARRMRTSSLQIHAAAAQDSGKRATKERTAQKKAAFATLREQLDALSRTVRAMARTLPGLAEKFRMPRSMAEQERLATARTFAEEAVPLKDELVRRGLPANFLEALNDTIDALQELISSKAEMIRARVAARLSATEDAGQGREAVREFGAIVRNIFRDDPAALAEWESASHTERSSRRAKDAAPHAQPAPAKGGLTQKRFPSASVSPSYRRTRSLTESVSDVNAGGCAKPAESVSALRDE